VVQGAFQRTLGRRHPAAGRRPHADRGSPDASDASHDLLGAQGIVWSRSGKGECLDKAGAERCFGS